MPKFIPWQEVEADERYRKLDSIGQKQVKARWEKDNKTAEPNIDQNEGIVGDTLTALNIGTSTSLPEVGLGLAKGLASSLTFERNFGSNPITRGLEKTVFGPLRSVIQKRREDLSQQYSPKTQIASTKTFLKDEYTSERILKKGYSGIPERLVTLAALDELAGDAFENTSTLLRKVYPSAVESLPLSAATMVPGGIAARSAGLATAAKVSKAALGRGMSKTAAKKLADKEALKTATRTAGVVSGAGEGVTGAGVAYNTTAAEVMDMSLTKLMQSPKYSEVLNSINPSLPPSQREQMAREELAALAGAQSAGIAFLFDATLGYAGDRYIGGAVMGKGSRPGSAIRGTISETPTETGQSMGEKFGENLAMQSTADPTRSLGEDVIEEGISGGLSGGMMGGGMGTVMHRSTKDDPGRSKLDKANALIEARRKKDVISVIRKKLSAEQIEYVKRSPEALAKYGLTADDLTTLQATQEYTKDEITNYQAMLDAAPTDAIRAGIKSSDMGQTIEANRATLSPIKTEGPKPPKAPTPPPKEETPPVTEAPPDIAPPVEEEAPIVEPEIEEEPPMDSLPPEATSQTVEEPVVEEPVVEEPVVEEPVVEEPVVEEPVVEEPVVEEPVVEKTKPQKELESAKTDIDRHHADIEARLAEIGPNTPHGKTRRAAKIKKDIPAAEQRFIRNAHKVPVNEMSDEYLQYEFDLLNKPESHTNINKSTELEGSFIDVAPNRTKLDSFGRLDSVIEELTKRGLDSKVTPSVSELKQKNGFKVTEPAEIEKPSDSKLFEDVERKVQGILPALRRLQSPDLPLSGKKKQLEFNQERIHELEPLINSIPLNQRSKNMLEVQIRSGELFPSPEFKEYPSLTAGAKVLQRYQAVKATTSEKVKVSPVEKTKPKQVVTEPIVEKPLEPKTKPPVKKKPTKKKVKKVVTAKERKLRNAKSLVTRRINKLAKLEKEGDKKKVSDAKTSLAIAQSALAKLTGEPTPVAKKPAPKKPVKKVTPVKAKSTNLEGAKERKLRNAKALVTRWANKLAKLEKDGDKKKISIYKTSLAIAQSELAKLTGEPTPAAEKPAPKKPAKKPMGPIKVKLTEIEEAEDRVDRAKQRLERAISQGVPDKISQAQTEFNVARSVYITLAKKSETKPKTDKKTEPVGKPKKHRKVELDKGIKAKPGTIEHVDEIRMALGMAATEKEEADLLSQLTLEEARKVWNKIDGLPRKKSIPYSATKASIVSHFNLHPYTGLPKTDKDTFSDGTPFFSLKDKPKGETLSVKEVESIIEKAFSKSKIIKVVPSIDKNLKGAEQLYDSTGKAAGVYYNGEILIAADAITDPSEVIPIVIHEGGHWLRDQDKSFQRTYSEFLTRMHSIGTGPSHIPSQRAAQEATRKALKQEGLNEDQLQEEAMMYFLQEASNVELPLYKKIVSFMKQMLFKHFKVPASFLKLSNYDMAQILVKGIKKKLNAQDAKIDSLINSMDPKFTLVDKDTGFLGKAIDKSKYGEKIKTPEVKPKAKAKKTKTKQSAAEILADAFDRNEEMTDQEFARAMHKQATQKAAKYSKNATVKKIAKDFDKYDIEFKRDGDTQVTSWIDRLASSPEYYSKKDGAAGRVVNAAMLEDEVKYRIQEEIQGQFAEFTKDIIKSNPKVIDEVYPYILNTDKTGNGFYIKYNDGLWEVYDPDGVMQEDWDERQHASDFLIDQEQLWVQDDHEGSKKLSRDARLYLLEYRQLMARSLAAQNADLAQQIENAEQAGLEEPTLGNGNKTLSEVIQASGDLEGTYFPRVRKKAKYYAKLAKPGNPDVVLTFDDYVPENTLRGPLNNKLRRLFNTKSSTGKEIKRLEKEGFKVFELGPSKAPADEVFDAIGIPKALDALVSDATDSVSDGQYKVQLLQFNNLILKAIGNIYKEKGNLSNRRKRSKEYSTGFETDVTKAAISHAQQVAAGIAKRTTAQAMVKAFTGHDLSLQDYLKDNPDGDFNSYRAEISKRKISSTKQKDLYKDMSTYIDYVLRPVSKVNQAFGYLKATAVLMYLGFRVSSAAVNMTNMVMGVPSTLMAHTGLSGAKAYGHVTSATSKYASYRSNRLALRGIAPGILKEAQYQIERMAKGVGKTLTSPIKLSEADEEIFDKIHHKGWDSPHFNIEAVRAIQDNIPRAFNKLMETSMYMFGATEKANRATTIFAAYQAHKENPANEGLSTEELLQLAKHTSDRAHGIYGKAAKPWLIQKAPILDLAYTFMKFQHNYILNAIEMGKKYSNWRASALAMTSPMLVAGLGAGFGAKQLLALSGAILPVFGLSGDDPEEAIYSWLEKNLGKFAERQGRHGLAGSLLGLNLKGSLAFNSPIGTGKITDLGGAPISVINDKIKAMEHFSYGEIAKGIEKTLPSGMGGGIAKAYRLRKSGYTTTTASPKFFGSEQMRATWPETIITALTLNPQRLASIQEQLWHERLVRSDFTKDRSKIMRRYKNYFATPAKDRNPKTLEKLNLMVADYNERVSLADPKYNQSYLTWPKIYKTLQQSMKPSKRERERGSK